MSRIKTLEDHFNSLKDFVRAPSHLVDPFAQFFREHQSGTVERQKHRLKDDTGKPYIDIFALESAWAEFPSITFRLEARYHNKEPHIYFRSLIDLGRRKELVNIVHYVGETKIYTPEGLSIHTDSQDLLSHGIREDHVPFFSNLIDYEDRLLHLFMTYASQSLSEKKAARGCPQDSN